MRLFALSLTLAALAGAAAAQDLGPPLSAEEFRARAEGWTLHFADEAGDYFGSEEYRAGDRTTFLPRGGQCLPGAWSQVRDMICFVHPDALACWRIYADGEDGVYAVSADPEGGPSSGAETRLRTMGRDRSPLVCPDGPGV